MSDEKDFRILSCFGQLACPSLTVTHVLTVYIIFGFYVLVWRYILATSIQRQQGDAPHATTTPIVIIITTLPQEKPL
jgi:hypothetical protein